MSDSPPPKSNHIRRYFIAGLITVIPLWITWLLLRFLFQTVSAVGEPTVQWLAKKAGSQFPMIEGILSSDTFQAILAFVFVMAVVFALGMLTTVVGGRKIVELFESILDRLPLVRNIYGAVKKLTTVLQEKPGGDVQRVVLIDFPSPEMKTVGLVTRVFEDMNTGRKLAAVYVPTTPNPTSGYLEIVPIDRLTPTDWSMDQAMSFIVSGGAIAPENIVYDKLPESNADAHEQS
jgi:uncharacterized membrane protein